MVTANRIPVPEPIAPRKSASTVSAPDWLLQERERERKGITSVRNLQDIQVQQIIHHAFLHNTHKPIHMPPNAAAVGMYRLRTCTKDVSR